LEPSLKNAIRLYRSRKFGVALEELRSLGETAPENTEIAYYTGLCYTQLERYDDALLYLEQVVTDSSNVLHVYQARMVLSYVYTITRRLKLAQFELDSLLESGYESPQVYAAYGYVAFESGMTDDALKLLQHALSIDPDNANALNSMGYILAENNRDLEYALSLCRRAVDIDGDNPAYLDSLGWVLYKLGNVREARVHLRKALNIAGSNKEIAAHMREVMSRIP
jgi:Flp pilus assembly protein TadD